MQLGEVAKGGEAFARGVVGHAGRQPNGSQLNVEPAHGATVSWWCALRSPTGLRTAFIIVINVIAPHPRLIGTSQVFSGLGVGMKRASSEF
jgi:hypothetical protein